VTLVAAPERLTERQRQILDQLGTLFEDGFAHLTMADIAARVHCSLRTLYTLAPSRDELVLMVVDPPPLDVLRTYLHSATVAVSRGSLYRVTHGLLDAAVARGDIADVDTAAVARVLAGVGRDLARPEVIPALRTSPKEAADVVVDLILKGLAR
jgi:hypothetical protein